MRKTIVCSLALLASVAFAPAGRAASDPRCGTKVSGSIELDADLLHCHGNGLVVAADDVEIDLNGFTLGGDGGAGSGVYNPGHDGLVVRDGTITGFHEGVLSKDARSNTMDGVAFVRDHAAVVFNKTSSGLVVHCEITDSGIGIVVRGNRNEVMRNEVSGGKPAIALIGDGNRAERNDVEYPDSRAYGPAIAFEGDSNALLRNRVRFGETGIDGIGDANLLLRNDVRDGSGHGIVVEGSRNDVESNDVSGFRRQGIWLSGGDREKGNRLVHNSASRNGRRGALVESASAFVGDNDFIRNGSDGLAVAGAQVRIDRNTLSHNGGYGVIVTSPKPHGQDNWGVGNAAKTQCVPSALCA